ncbi:hypothetical protein CO154_02115 [Candidatus Pacearchaeota archaeon CG_4_9_14_3_um_filter_31_7]|nr:MAG: hypothetical protein AUJ10_03720 [Candidatus Pacearchaeota archaeon CG1_02_31_27]PIN91833.1 MAG: hypothetical protein COU55_03565 [Candidatus Pacearchaeota archaeon CG10_big_fil_rev_8_21_14_0_10_31_59]PIZ80540.1 MAG: hypothetical protein COX99_02615 [Candidatus Pacearchaeota archaeon CG_4_10_14_0_2_um_filter_31_10]PJA70582.1 MAG: hypothetical protein CO154_02115 [Candidatus Pacearchaeota archaeon CG_4_9_14_3_um_filter_31_7]
MENIFRFCYNFRIARQLLNIKGYYVFQAKGKFRMKIGIKVGDIMTINMEKVNPTTSIKDCAKKMVSKRVGSLVIVNKDELKGIITDRDLLWVFTKKRNVENEKVEDIMNKNVVTTSPELDIYDALQLMKKKNIRWLPVISKEKGKKRLIGLLTQKDILKVQPALFDIAVGNLDIKEEYEKMKRIENLKRKGDAPFKDGECEECGRIGLLYKIYGKNVCINCRDEIESKV